jgi:hypothetical protein
MRKGRLRSCLLTFQVNMCAVVFQRNSHQKTDVQDKLLRPQFLHIQGVSEIRVLILTSGRTRQIMELFSMTFLRKSIQIDLKINKSQCIPAYG